MAEEMSRTRVMFNDMLNLPRGKYVPVDVAAGGKIGFARGAFAVSYDRDLLFLAAVFMMGCLTWISFWTPSDARAGRPARR